MPYFSSSATRYFGYLFCLAVVTLLSSCSTAPVVTAPAFKQALCVFAFGAQDHVTYGNAARQYRQASSMLASGFVFASNEFIGFR